MDKRQEIIRKVIDGNFTEKQLQLIIDKLKEMLKAQNEPKIKP